MKCDSNEDRRIFTYSSFHFIIFSPSSSYDFFFISFHAENCQNKSSLTI